MESRRIKCTGERSRCHGESGGYAGFFVTSWWGASAAVAECPKVWFADRPDAAAARSQNHGPDASGQLGQLGTARSTRHVKSWQRNVHTMRVKPSPRPVILLLGSGTSQRPGHRWPLCKTADPTTAASPRSSGGRLFQRARKGRCTPPGLSSGAGRLLQGFAQIGGDPCQTFNASTMSAAWRARCARAVLRWS